MENPPNLHMERAMRRYNDWNRRVARSVAAARAWRGRSGIDLVADRDRVASARDHLQLALDALWDAPADNTPDALVGDIENAEAELAAALAALDRRSAGLAAPWSP